jgi:hypothetical protein
MSQRERILEELKKGDWLSLADTLHWTPPIYALSQRVGELVKQGYDIESERVPGHPYFRYRLRKSETEVEVKPMDIEWRFMETAYGPAYRTLTSEPKVESNQASLFG